MRGSVLLVGDVGACGSSGVDAAVLDSMYCQQFLYGRLADRILHILNAPRTIYEIYVCAKTAFTTHNSRDGAFSENCLAQPTARSSTRGQRLGP